MEKNEEAQEQGGVEVAAGEEAGAGAPTASSTVAETPAGAEPSSAGETPSGVEETPAGETPAAVETPAETPAGETPAAVEDTNGGHEDGSGTGSGSHGHGAATGSGSHDHGNGGHEDGSGTGSGSQGHGHGGHGSGTGSGSHGHGNSGQGEDGGIVEGKAYDITTGNGVAHAQIHLDYAGQELFSAEGDDHGSFEVHAPPAAYEATAFAEGYCTASESVDNPEPHRPITRPLALSPVLSAGQVRLHLTSDGGDDSFSLSVYGPGGCVIDGQGDMIDCGERDIVHEWLPEAEP